MVVARTRLTLFRALYNRPFALLWTGQTVSRVGDHLYQLALAWWVLQATGSAALMGAVLVLSFAPLLLFALLGGVVGDRLPRVRVMLASDLVRGLVVSVVAALALTGRLEVWHVFAASVIFGIADAFFQPAYSALIPTILAADDLTSGNSINSLGLQFGRIAGPALGAVLIASGGAGLAFALNALSFFIAAACLLPLWNIETAKRKDRSPSNVLEDLRQGIDLVLDSPWLWVTLLVVSLVNVTLAGPYNVSLPFLVDGVLGLPVSFLGLLYAAFAAGYIVSGVWLGRQTTFRRRAWKVYGGLMVAGLGMLALGLPLPPALLLLAAFANGAALELTNLIWTHSVQASVAPDRLGRFAALELIGSFGLLPLGFALTGWATDLLGPAAVCVLGGGLTILIAVLGLAHPGCGPWTESPARLRDNRKLVMRTLYRYSSG